MRLVYALVFLLFLPVVIAVDFEYLIGTQDVFRREVFTCKGRDYDGDGEPYCSGGPFSTAWNFYPSGDQKTYFLGHSSRVCSCCKEGAIHHCNSNRYAVSVYDGSKRVYFRNWLGDGHWEKWNAYSYPEIDELGDRLFIYDMQMHHVPGENDRTHGFFNDDSVEAKCPRVFDFSFDVLSYASAHVSSVVKSDGLFQLGILNQLHDASYTSSYDVLSLSPRVKVFFGNNPGTTSTTFKGAVVNACLDMNEDGECDYSEFAECRSQGKDGYTSGLPGESDACCGDYPYNTCDYFSNKNAVCGFDSSNVWHWVPLGQIGLVGDLSGCWNVPFELVSDGAEYFACGGSAGILGFDYSVVADGSSVNIGGHDYVCAGNHFVECGAGSPFSVEGKSAGASLSVANETLFCSSAGLWSSSLDGDEDACVAAGFDWTGSKCCGEPYDSLVTYQEDRPALGGCFNNNFIASGETMGNGTVLNYQGIFVVCDPSAQPMLQQSISPVAPFSSLNPFIYGLCGSPLNISSAKFAVCNDFGWSFRDSYNLTYSKSVVWQTSFEQSGCCVLNECWNGEECVSMGEYYQVGSRGFRCV